MASHYIFEIEDLDDRQILCELLTYDRKNREEDRLGVIIQLLATQLKKIDTLSAEVAELKSVLNANTSSSEEVSIKDDPYSVINAGSPINYTEKICKDMEGFYINTPSSEEASIKDDLYSVINAGSPINYTKSICNDMERIYIWFLLESSGIKRKDAIWRKYEFPFLRRLVGASIRDFTELETIGPLTAKKLRAYLDEKFGKSKRLFSPEIVQEIKEVFLQYCFAKGNVDKIIERYPTFEDLAQTSKKELLLLSDKTSVEKFCVKLEKNFDIKIRD